MPSISKIRLTNVVYEDGMKRYQDEEFIFDGHNGAIVLENGGGKTVFIQTVLQCMLPKTSLAGRHIKDTLQLEVAPAHIGIEWIINENPRHYAVTCVTLHLGSKGTVEALRYVHEYYGNSDHALSHIPFVKKTEDSVRPADRGEMLDYYNGMKNSHPNLAHTFDTDRDYKFFLEEKFNIIADEWESIVKINSSEGGIEAYFEACKSANDLFDRLLIPTVESSIMNYDAKRFANTFELERSNFRELQNLLRLIEENQEIEQQLSSYVEVFIGLDQSETTFAAEKGYARAVYEWLETEIHRLNEGIAETEQQVVQLQKQRDEHTFKEQSFALRNEEARLSSMQTSYQRSVGELAKVEEDLKRITDEHDSLAFAQLQRLCEEKEQLCAAQQQLLHSLDAEEDVNALLQSFKVASGKLHGGFQNQLNKIEDEKNKLTS
ncbi:MAG: hypothetical protein ACRCWQ_12340, partial [Bacilli bacterium]